MKRDIFHEGLVESWKEVLAELGPAVEEIATVGSDVSFSWSFVFVRQGGDWLRIPDCS